MTRIYCSFAGGECPLEVEITSDCRVIRGYECHIFSRKPEPPMPRYNYKHKF